MTRGITHTWREALHIAARWYTPDSTFPDGEIVWTEAATGEQIVIEVTPLWCGATVSLCPEPLTLYIADGSWRELLEQEPISALLTKLRTTEHVLTVGVITIWECESGVTYIPGEPDDYFSDAQYVGYLAPRTLEYVPHEEAQHASW